MIPGWRIGLQETFASLGGILHPMGMDTKLAISVLDLVGMRPGESAGSAIARSVELAKHVEKLGYKRYWLAEHHSIAGLACSATSILIGHVARRQKTIRVGSGGVMLRTTLRWWWRRSLARWKRSTGKDRPGTGSCAWRRLRHDAGVARR